MQSLAAKKDFLLLVSLMKQDGEYNDQHLEKVLCKNDLKHYNIQLMIQTQLDKSIFFFLTNNVYKYDKKTTGISDHFPSSMKGVRNRLILSP